MVYTRAAYLWAQLFCDFNLNQTAVLSVWVPLGKGRTGSCLNVCCYFHRLEKALGYGKEKAKSRSNHKRENLAACSLSALPDVCHHHRDTILVCQLLLGEIPVGLGKVGLKDVK